MSGSESFLLLPSHSQQELLQRQKYEKRQPKLLWPSDQKVTAGTKIQRFHGTDQDFIAFTPPKKDASVKGIESGATGLPVDNSTPQQSLELPTEPCHVELRLNLDGKGGEFKLESLIVVPTYQDALGIFREVSAFISNIALRVQSNGG